MLLVHKAAAYLALCHKLMLGGLIFIGFAGIG